MMRRIGCDQGFVGNFKKRREAAAVSVAGKADTAAGGGCVVIPDYGFFFYGKKAPIGCGQGTQEKTSAVCGVIICKGSLPGYRYFIPDGSGEHGSCPSGGFGNTVRDQGITVHFQIIGEGIACLQIDTASFRSRIIAAQNGVGFKKEGTAVYPYQGTVGGILLRMGFSVSVQKDAVQMQRTAGINAEHIIGKGGCFGQRINIGGKTAESYVTLDFQNSRNRYVRCQLNGGIGTGECGSQFCFIGNLSHKISPFSA